MNATRLIAFALIVGVTLVVTVLASRRTHSATDFFAAGRGTPGPRNGLAIAGDLMSAATFLGFTGLMYLSGFDGWIMPVVTLVAFVLILLLFAERMRNADRHRRRRAVVPAARASGPGVDGAGGGDLSGGSAGRGRSADPGALSVAAGANFPALLLALTWRRFTTTGAIVGIVAGLVTSVVCILLGPSVWPGGAGSTPYPIEYPTLLAIPIGFLACWLGTVLSSERGAERSFDELQVRSQTGIGSEQTPVSH